MAETLKIYQALQAYIDSVGVQAGSRVTPAEVSVAGSRYDATATVTNSSGDNYNSQTLWESGDGGLTSFDLCMILSDADVLVEFENDATSAESFFVEVLAGVPLILGGDAVTANDDGSGVLGADGSATDVSDLIDKITVKNNADGTSADVSATVRLILFD